MIKSLHIASFAMIVLLVFSPAIYSQTSVFYVATDGDNFKGDGSEKNPWATITHALDNVPDGSVIFVKPGEYFGRIRIRGTFEQGVSVVSQQLYQARLRNDDRVFTFYQHSSRGCHGISIVGFDVAHSGPGAGPIVAHLDGGGRGLVSNITLRDNIFHDSYNNDILKINNHADNIVVERNVFYNQGDSDEHIDINSVEGIVVQDNIFFNDYAASGRVNSKGSSSHIVVKDSNGNDDNILGSSNIKIRRNIFLNWQGTTGHNFVLLGEDGQPYYEAFDVMVENNLLIGNSSEVMRAAFGVKGCRDITFRHNTIVGNLPARAFLARLNTEGYNPPNQNIRFFNNICSDPTGTMGALDPSGSGDLTDSPPEDTLSFAISNNLYWNGGKSIPNNSDDLVKFENDSKALQGDPLLGSQKSLVPPVWRPKWKRFVENSRTIRQAFESLVDKYGKPANGSAAIDKADDANASDEDILGNARSGKKDIGAYEQISYFNNNRYSSPISIEISTSSSPESPTPSPLGGSNPSSLGGSNPSSSLGGANSFSLGGADSSALQSQGFTERSGK